MIKLSEQNEIILLGSGGDGPGVDALNIKTGEVQRLVSFEPGESVYSMSFCPDGDKLAIATKAGGIYVSDYSFAQPGKPVTARKLGQGAAALSIVFLDEHRVAVSDTAGQSTIWSMVDSEPCDRLMSSKGAVCSLFRINHDHLAGLSVDGELLVWDLESLQIVDVLNVPKLPVLGALVQSVWWRAAGCWVWAGNGGIVVCYNVDQNKITTLDAHCGQFYANAVCDDELITVGKDDRLVKLWQIGSDQPARSITVNPGVIAISVWGSEKKRILLVNENGQAEVGSLCDDHLDDIVRLSGCDYRVVVEPDRELYRSRLRQLKIENAEQLAMQIKANIESHQYEGIDQLHEQLVQLGFRHLSLLLYARKAQLCDDAAGEISTYRELHELLEQKQHKLPDSLMRYGQLLEQAWLFEQAESVYRKLLTQNPGSELYRNALERAGYYVKLLCDGHCVIDSEIEIPTLIELRSAAGESFEGRYVVKELSKPVQIDGSLCAADFIEIYESLRQKTTQISLPPVRQQKLNWISRDEKGSKDTLIFTANSSGLDHAHQLMVQIITGRLQTVFAPMIIFEIPQKTASLSINTHNQLVLERLQLTENKRSDYAWLKKVYFYVNQVLRQLFTRQMANRER